MAMARKMQYITNEAGDRVGLLFDLDTYQKLTAGDRVSELLTIRLSTPSCK